MIIDNDNQSDKNTVYSYLSLSTRLNWRWDVLDFDLLWARVLRAALRLDTGGPDRWLVLAEAAADEAVDSSEHPGIYLFGGEIDLSFFSSFWNVRWSALALQIFMSTVPLENTLY